MTSAHQIEYTITDLNGKVVGEHRQNVLCKTKWGRLLAFVPPENYFIQSWGFDENEARWENEPIRLDVFIAGLVKNKAKFNVDV